MSESYIRLVESSCRSCMRCVRACPTKAMTYIHLQPVIQEDTCILCGQCYRVCPHEAKSIRSDFAQVRKWLADGEQVVLSAAPSFVSVWPRFEALSRILKGRGFTAVEETAHGAYRVSQAYEALIEQHQMPNIITTCCPAVNTLIEKEYPDLVPLMAPVVSPLIAHGRDLRQRYPGAKVVFLSPCIAKYKEIRDPRFADAVDACISMQELYDWLGTTLEEEEEADWQDFAGSIARLYPTPGGVLSTLADNSTYKYIHIEGNQRIRKLLNALREGHLNGYFIETTFCEGSCMGGPLLSHFEHNEWLGQSIIRENVDLKRPAQARPADALTQAAWQPHPAYHPHYSEEEIQAELIREGKISPAQFHDCGACGYETCREKAIAVLAGQADPHICLPMALERAESISSVIMENTPNGFIVLNRDGTVRDMNPAARKMLQLQGIDPTGFPLEAVLPSEKLQTAVQEARTAGKTTHVREHYEQYGRLIEHAIFYLPDQDMTVLILMDVTSQEAREQTLKKMREDTLEVTQQVIDEQMRSVQEIASLLGETTARSKVALTRLKNAMKEEEQDEQ